MGVKRKNSFSTAVQTLMDRSEELEGIIRFWLETAQLNDAPIYDYMEKYGVDKLSVKVVSEYVFEFEDDE